METVKRNLGVQVVRNLKYFIIFSLLSIIFIQVIFTQPYTPLKLSFRIYSTGLVEVNYVVELKSNETLTTEITLIGAPFIEDKTAYVIILDENGVPVPFNLTENKITADTLGVSLLNITYFTYDLTEKKKALWRFEVFSPINFTVILPENTTIVGLSAVPIKIVTVNGKVVVVMPAGKQCIEYVPSLPKTIIPSKSSQKPSQEQPTVKEQKKYPFELTIVILSAAAIAAIAVALLFLKGRKKVILTEEEEAIVKALKRHGGEAYQFEIARELPFPKTTLWKYVRRLEEKGILVIEKRGPQNYLILKKS